MVRLAIFVLLLIISKELWSQSTDFQILPNACINESLKIKNLSSGAINFQWDFCDRDLMTAPQSSVNATLSQVVAALDVRAKYDHGNWYSFICDADGDKLIKLSYGNSLSNTPTQTTIGQFLIPSGIELVELNGQWIGLLGTFSLPSKLYVLNFGASLNNSPTIAEVNLVSTDIFSARSIRIVKQGTDIIALVANSATSRITRINFGTQITTTPVSVDYISVSTTQSLGLDNIETSTGNYVVLTGYGNSQISKLDFGSDWMGAPVLSTINTGAFTLTNPSMVELEFEGGNYYMLSVLNSGQVFRMNFGSTLTSNNPVIDDLGFFGTMVNVRGMDLVRENGMYKSLFSSYSSDKLFCLDFKDPNCSASLETSTEIQPPLISYSSNSTYPVTLRSVYSDLKSDHATHSVVVGVDASPGIDFNSEEKCTASINNFYSQTPGPITAYAWSFGDTQSSTDPNPTHQYAVSGDYNVTLIVTAANGCTNYAEETISIYDEPVPDFLVPAVNPVCTNQNFIFENTSTTDPGYPVTWQWSVNGAVKATSEDFSFLFTQASNQDIMLSASIPGCENTVTKSFTTVEGPVTDFSFSGHCEDENVIFTNNSSGVIVGYSWNFDDGTNSTDTSPVHIFSPNRVYDVTLTASNVNCNNTKTKSVTIYSKPQVNFQLSPPPFSCNGTPSEFKDLTPTPSDSNIASWAWNFGDAGSSLNTSTLQNPQHTYSNSGNYNVSLLVTTNFSCSATLQLPVVISPSPVANFNHGATCEDVPSNFTDASTGTISSRNWMIGSTSYTSQNPSHTFNNPGNTSATLIVTASNGCIGSVTKPIVVPVKLTPDFSVNRNCVNQQTVFTDLTNATADPLSLQSWNFGAAGTGTGSPVNVTFTNTGNVNVTLSVTTQSGCVYPVTKPVNIISSPQASFTPSPLVGAPPLSVVFTNTSVNATSYQWAFKDPNNSTSTVVSPTFVYQALGEYPAELTAFNTQNCFHKTTRIIRVVVPVVDVALGGLELMEYQNGFKPAVTIFNHGNVPLVNLALLLNMSGPVIREHVNAVISPNTSYRHVLSIEFPESSNVDYFCVEADVTDITPTDNEVCLSLEESFTIFPPYPNPSKGSFQVDWIMKEAGTVNLTVSNSMGQEMQNLKIESVEGLNPLTLETYGLSSGVYFVKIKYQQFTKVYRVFVSE